MKSLLILCLIISVNLSFAQEISEALIIDDEVNFCKPGVTNKSPGKGLLLDYRYQPSFTFKNDEVSASTIDNNIRINSKLKIPLVIKPGFKLLVGFNYQIENFNFAEKDISNSSVFRSLDGKDLKNSGVAFYISKPLNERFYTSFRLGVTYTGDYNTFSTLQDRYATYRAIGILGIKKKEDLEFGFGVMFSKSFRNTLALPFGFVNRTFNDRWGIEFAIPLSFKVRYDINDGSLFMFGPQFASQSYSIDVAKSDTEIVDIFHFRRAGVETSLTFQQRIKGWFWVEANVGYLANLNAKVKDTSQNGEIKFDQSNSVYGSIGIFLSPPSKNRVCKEGDY